jgi:predicted transcriptional regulator
VLQDLSATVRENIEAALRERDLCCLSQVEDNIEILGKISEPLRQTFEFARHKGFITTADVEKKFKLQASAGSNRLSTLEKMGLIYKVEEGPTSRGGKQYTFRVVS